MNSHNVHTTHELGSRFYSRFTEITAAAAASLAKQFASPLYLVDIKSIRERLQQFQHLAKQHYPNTIIALSYKTNPLQGLLAQLHEQHAYAEVVSGDEYRIARQLQVEGRHIIFNGPMKTEHELATAITEGAYINCDHADEVERIAHLAQQLNQKVKIGIRLCFSSEDQTHWNRFGFVVDKTLDTADSAYAIIERIIRSPHLSLQGIHAHIGTNIRDLAQFARLGHRMALFATELLEQHHLPLAWLDVGGGLAGISPRIDEEHIEPHPLPSLADYVKAITTPLLTYLNRLPEPATVFFEPGRTLFEPFCGLLTQVVGHRKLAGHTRELICDAGFNTLATSHVYNHPLHIPGPTSLQQAQTVLYGPTCNQADKLHQPLQLPILNPGDFIVFYGVGAYCMSFSYSFIRYRPGVVAWEHADHAAWLRYPESLEHASTLEVVNYGTNPYAASAY